MSVLQPSSDVCGQNRIDDTAQEAARMQKREPVTRPRPNLSGLAAIFPNNSLSQMFSHWSIVVYNDCCTLQENCEPLRIALNPFRCSQLLVKFTFPIAW